MSTSKSNIAKIWKSVQDGNREAFNQIFIDNIDDLYNYGMSISNDSHSIEDAIQDIFLTLWKSKSSLNINSSIRNYLFTALRRRLINNLHSTKMTQLESNESIVKRNITTEKVEDEMPSKLSEIQKMINELPPREKEAIVLKYQENLDYDEMTSIMNLKKHAIYKLVSRAIKKMSILKDWKDC